MSLFCYPVGPITMDKFCSSSDFSLKKACKSKKRLRRVFLMFWKNFGIFILAGSALWPTPSMASALQWEFENGVYYGLNDGEEGYDYPQGLPSLTAILKMGLVNAEIRARRNGDHHEAMAYFSLPEKIQEWLKRLGLVAEEGEFFRFTRSLNVEYRVYPSIQSIEALHLSIRTNQDVAVKLLPLDGGEVNFSIPADRSDNTSLVQSLPNGFFLRQEKNLSGTWSIDLDDLKKWQKIRVTAYDPSKKLVFASIAVLPNPPKSRIDVLDGEMRVIVHVVLPEGFVIQNTDDIESILASLVPEGALNCVTPMQAEQRERNEALLRAAEDNNIREMEALLQRGADVGSVSIEQCRFAFNRMPIHFVAKNGSIEGLKILYKYGTPLGVPAAFMIGQCDGFSGETPLHLAVEKGHIEFVTTLLSDMGLSPEQIRLLLEYTNGYGLTPFSLAAQAKEDAIVEALLPLMTLEQMQIQDNNGKIAIHLAARSGSASIVQLLLEDFKSKGVDENAIKRMFEGPKTEFSWFFRREDVQKFPDCVQILKPYVPEL
jgi:hypothetical protein